MIDLEEVELNIINRVIVGKSRFELIVVRCGQS